MKPLRISAASWLWLSAAAAVAIAVAWLLWPRPIVVETAVIDRGDVRQDLEEEGRVRIRDVYTLTAPVGGLLQRVELRAGDPVKSGDIVATIVPASPSLLDARTEKEAAAAILSARSALAMAEADERLARTENDRTSQLFAHGFASKAALDRSQAALLSAAASVSQRKADLQRALAAASRPASRMKKTEIRSPAAGRVLQVLQESETTVPSSSAILDIGDPTKIEIVAEYVSQDAGLMREGACAMVQIPGGREIAARVKTIEPFARTKVSALGVEEQRVNIVLDLEGGAPAAGLGHGYRVDVRVALFERSEALRVPTDALIRNNNGDWAIFRVVNGRTLRTAVRIGGGDDRFREVVEGLHEGDEVVLFPDDSLKDRALVTRSN